jgi:hypothetical protein
LLGIGFLIILLIFGGSQLLSAGPTDSSDQDQGAPAGEPAFEPQTNLQPTARPDFTPPPRSTDGQTWLVMLYMDADDKILEQDIHVDLNEVERIGSTDRVQIVAQIDRFSGGFPGDGNWTSTRRYYITPDEDLSQLNSQEIADLGEINMADGDTLIDFATWAIQSFPSDRYVLILSDHGLGWPGGWSDPEPAVRPETDTALAERIGNHLFLNELDQALGSIRAQTGIERFELIGFDACLMGQIEVFQALQPHARYAVASQEVEPSLGWAYAGFLSALTENPDMNGEDLGRLIVQSYIAEDQRIVDDTARAEFSRQNSLVNILLAPASAPSAEQITRQLSSNITLSAINLDLLPGLMESLNQLSYALQTADPQSVAKARTYAQSFTSVFGSEVPPSYLDLGSFVQLLDQFGAVDSKIIDPMQAAIANAVIAEKHGSKKPGATGIAFYFPNSQLYANAMTGAESYVKIAERFAAASLWDDFLAYHYTGRSFDLEAAEAVLPSRSAEITAPAAGEITISALSLSDDSVSPGEKILIQADISGTNIGYINLFVGYIDSASNSIYVADIDYLDSSEIQSIGDLYYPVWGESEPFTLEFEWEPVVFGISDGTTLASALFNPERYGATAQEALYSVDGMYQDADDGATRFARLYFSDGILRQVLGFTKDESGSVGAPWEIHPEPGDTFTILDKWLDLDSQGRVTETSFLRGQTLTFGDQPFTWETLDAAAGEYIVGFLVQDLDGKLFPAYATVTVR